MVSSRSSGLTGVTSNIVASNNIINNNNNNNINSEELETSSSPVESSTIGASTSCAKVGTSLIINDKNAPSFGTKERRITEGTEEEERIKTGKETSRSQSGPSSLVSNLVSGCSSVEGGKGNTAEGTNGDYGDAESYEGFGYARSHNDRDLEVDVDARENDGDGGLDSSSSAPSPTGPNSLSL